MNRESPSTAVNIVTIFAALLIVGAPLLYLRWTAEMDMVIQRHSQLATIAAAWGGVIGVLVLVFYTKETYLLRKTSEQQIENSVKPIILFDLASIDVPLGTPMQLKAPAIQNVGAGPAFNVTVSPLSGNGVNVHFAGIRLAPAQKDQVLDFTITQGGDTNGMSKQLTLLADMFRRTDTFPDIIVAVIEFDSVTGKRYRTLHEIKKEMAAKTVVTCYRNIETIQ